MAEQQDYSRRRIFTVLGVLPEPGGYGIAKFSRSSKPYREWIMDLTQEGAERFYRAFYFDYGHASIADLAHITVVIENVSMVAAEELWDHPLIDGQASSTRYQDFQKRGFHLPAELEGSGLEGPYRRLCEELISEYAAAHKRLTAHLMGRYASPPEMDEAQYERILKARAYDTARYLLPMAIRTGLGHILSARTLERQLVRLLSHPLSEIREIAQELKEAAVKRPAFNPTVERLQPILKGLDEQSAEKIRKIVGFDAPAVPTLVKYARPSEYLMRTREELQALAAEYAAKLGEPDGRRGVELFTEQDPLVEQACTLLYRFLPHSYAQILSLVEALPSEEISEIIELAYRHRGEHDTPLSETYAGCGLLFDLCLDCGSWRDFHRHRRLVQINKDFHPLYGYEVPAEIREAGLFERYSELMDEAGALASEIDRELPGVGQYALPFAYRRRSLLKMDTGELQYIVELRTRPENHFSVRRAAYEMYLRFRERFPEAARHIRAVDPTYEEFFKR
jgi:thymidylate synthase ThyX